MERDAQLIQMVHDYAAQRQQQVTHGRESPELAALLVQKYGYGVVDAVQVLGDAQTAARVLQAVDAVVTAIDPQWGAHAQQRWARLGVTLVGLPGEAERSAEETP
jgi:hypothetical protein